MQILYTTEQLRQWRAQAGRAPLGLVPTMGNLHAGHQALLEAAVARCDRVVASIFVNPLQFGPQEDLATYPRTLDADLALLDAIGVDAAFVPSVEQMYPHGGESLTRIHVDALASALCGRQRPGHFEGVATVVTKLFNLVRPDSAFFGEKDYQQLVVIRRVAADLCMAVDVVGVATVREADGLALSSRNQYLGTQQRRHAPQLANALSECVQRLAAGERAFDMLEERGLQQLQQAGFTPEYFAIRDAQLGRPDAGTHAFRVLAAGVLGQARLIDNMGLVVARQQPAA